MPDQRPADLATTGNRADVVYLVLRYPTPEENYPILNVRVQAARANPVETPNEVAIRLRKAVQNSLRRFYQKRVEELKPDVEWEPGIRRSPARHSLEACDMTLHPIEGICMSRGDWILYLMYIRKAIDATLKEPDASHWRFFRRII